MKPKEAVDGLNYMISGGCTDSHWDFIDEIELAIEALEKQIPKKPVIDPVDCAEVCPNCKSTGIREDYGAPNDYCSECGQAIDWSE